MPPKGKSGLVATRHRQSLALVVDDGSFVEAAEESMVENEKSSVVLEFWRRTPEATEE